MTKAPIDPKDIATCRNCGLVLEGRDYRFGGEAYHPVTKERVKKNHYGGYVCSARCDYRASLDLEQSMPGHGYHQKTLGCFAQEAYDNNWRPK